MAISKLVIYGVLAVGLIGGNAYVLQNSKSMKLWKVHEVADANDAEVNVGAVEVKEAIEQFRTAMVERNPDNILKYASPKLTFGHSNGVVQTREEFAEVVRSGTEIFNRVDLTNNNLTMLGKTAVERHHFSADIIYEGKLMNFELEVVEVWQKGPSNWQLVARQAVNTNS